VSEAPSTSRRRARKLGAREAAIAFSLFTHLLIFAILARNIPTLIFRDEPVAATNIWLMPRLTPQAHEEATRQHAAPAASSAPAAAPAATPKPLTATATAPSPVQAAPQTAPAQAEGGAPAPGGAGAALQGALRTTIGCDLGHAAHLTPEEKDHCNLRLGEEAHKGPKFIDTIPPEKRAYYDAVQQAYQAAADPMHPFVRDKYGNIQTWGHPPAVGCSFKGHFKPGASLSDKIKATGMIGVPIGPLSCGLALPQGSMTPELGIPTP
jgi:hypothetical protein